MSRYTIPTIQKGVAFYVRGPAQVWEPYTYIGHYGDCDDPSREPGLCCNVTIETDEGEFVDDPERMRVVMVGDDHEYTCDRTDLVELDENDYCAECGQIGCTADGRDRT